MTINALGGLCALVHKPQERWKQKGISLTPVLPSPDPSASTGLSSETHSCRPVGSRQGPKPCQVQKETLFPSGACCGGPWRGPTTAAGYLLFGDPCPSVWEEPVEVVLARHQERRKDGLNPAAPSP